MGQGPVTDEQVQAFADDGVVCLRGAFGPDWIEPLRRGMDRALAGPSERRRIWDADDRGGTTTYDNQCWLHVPEYRDFAEHSPMAEIAGRLLGASAVNFFFDAVFVRTAGVRFRTPFHQDEPYWSVEGFDTCSAWMPLVPVARESALEFVRGSHRWDQRYRQENFGVLTGDDRDQVRYGVADDGRVPFPDIEGDRDAYEILGWDMEPGDVIGTLLIFCPLAMYIVASEVVSKNACVETVIPLLQFVDGVKVTDASCVQDRNALVAISVTDAGISMEVSPVW